MTKGYHLVRVARDDPRYFLVNDRYVLLCGHQDWIADEYDNLLLRIEPELEYEVVVPSTDRRFVTLFDCVDAEGATTSDLTWENSTYILPYSSKIPVLRRDFIRYADYLFARSSEQEDDYSPDTHLAISSPSLSFGNIAAGDIAVVADRIENDRGVEKLGTLTYWNFESSADLLFWNYLNPVVNKMNGAALYTTTARILSSAPFQQEELPSWLNTEEGLPVGATDEDVQYAANVLGMAGVLGLATFLEGAESTLEETGYRATEEILSRHTEMFERHQWSELYIAFRTLADVLVSSKGRRLSDSREIRRRFVAYIGQTPTSPALIARYAEAGVLNVDEIESYIASGIEPDLVERLVS